MIELELIMIFVCCLIFSCLYELFHHAEESRQVQEGSSLSSTVFGIIGSFCWIILSLVYFVGAAQEGRPYVISLFFSGIGIIYIVRWIIDLINMGKWARELGEVEL